MSNLRKISTVRNCLATLCCPNDFLDSYLNNDTVVVAVTDNKNIVNDFFDLGQHRTFLGMSDGRHNIVKVDPKESFPSSAVRGCEKVILIHIHTGWYDKTQACALLQNRNT